jgi:hypothetical protein
LAENFFFCQNFAIFFIVEQNAATNKSFKTLKNMGQTLKEQNQEKYPNGYVIRNGITFEDYKLMSEDEKELKFPFGYVSSTGITREEYQSMSSDEQKLEYPYGCTIYMGIVTPCTEEQHLGMLENVRILTEDLMNREGMEVNQNLRDKFPDSYFYQICYDDAIIGVNPITQSVIYDCMRFGQLRVMFCEWIYPDYGDTMFGVTDIIKWVRDIIPIEKLEGKVPPTLVLLDTENFNKYWEDIQYPNW